MKLGRSVLLVTSTIIVLALLGGGMTVRLGAEDNSFRQAVVFAEILSLVLENYVDPVESDGLLQGAYEGLLAGLDPNSAFLNPDEVRQWRQAVESSWVGAGISVLKAGRTLQVIAVDPGSSAESAGIAVGDQIRTIEGQATQDLSVAQSRRLLRGPNGSSLDMVVLRPRDEFRSESVQIIRGPRVGRAYDLAVDRGTAVLTLRDLQRIEAEELWAELDDVRSRGVERLLLDIRNLGEHGPADAIGVAALFTDAPTLKLLDREGNTVREVTSETRQAAAWSGSLAVLINGATAWGAEALAQLIQTGRDAVVYGESSFGWGTEPELIELPDGSGVLISATIWETGSGERWDDSGLAPDEEVSGKGDDSDTVFADQLKQVLDLLEKGSERTLPKAA